MIGKQTGDEIWYPPFALFSVGVGELDVEAEARGCDAGFRPAHEQENVHPALRGRRQRADDRRRRRRTAAVYSQVSSLAGEFSRR